jgi:signal transduction histidine kinase
VLVAGAFVQVNYRPGSEDGAFLLLNALLAGAVVLNTALHLRLHRHAPIQLWFPILLGFYDAVAVTGAIAIVDGFTNPSFVLYYPALLSFVLVFPGRWSVVYTAVIIAAYVAATVPGRDNFDIGSTGDQKALILRLLTMATASFTANLVVRYERLRRLAAVSEALASEQRAADAERRVEHERSRLSQEVHDGISQAHCTGCRARPCSRPARCCSTSAP